MMNRLKFQHCIMVAIMLGAALHLITNAAQSWRIYNGYREHADGYQDGHNGDQYNQHDNIENHHGDTQKTMCSRKKNIAFIKTVKTGGSTLAGILARHALQYDLSTLGYESCADPDLMLTEKPCGLYKLQSFDVKSYRNRSLLSAHIPYDRKALKKVMPPDTVYLTQLRQPIKQLESFLNYNGIKGFKTGLNDPVDAFNQLEPFIQRSRWTSWRQLCLKDEDFLTQLQTLEKEFFMVGITEQFDLSLILLRRHLCWDIGDIVYTPLKTATPYSTAGGKQNQTDSSQPGYIHSSKLVSSQDKFTNLDSRYRTANPNAYIIYDYFYRIFMEKVAKENQEDLKAELEFFNEVKSKIQDYCPQHFREILKEPQKFLDTVDQKEALHFPESPWGSAFHIDPVMCALQRLHKITFEIVSTVKQFPEICQRKTDKTHVDLKKIRVPVSATDTHSIIHPAFCKLVHPKYEVPLEILKYRDSYDLEEHVSEHRKYINNMKHGQFTKKNRKNSEKLDKCVLNNYKYRRNNSPGLSTWSTSLIFGTMLSSILPQILCRGERG